VKLFPSIILVLKYVEKEEKCDKKSQSHGIVAYFEAFDFVFYLHMMLHILGSANTLSQSLQKGSRYLECHVMCEVNKK
jgi:hypothetical protein